MFEAGAVDLGSACADSPPCIVSERGEYSLATYLGRMQRRGGASARPKALLSHALEAVAYLHGRNMARPPASSLPASTAPSFSQITVDELQCP